MVIGNSLNISYGTVANGEVSNKAAEQRNGKQNVKLFAGDMNLMNDPIKDRKALAHKKALQLVKDQFATDKRIDDKIKAKQLRQEELMQEALEAQSKVAEMDKLDGELMEKYEITEDSQEHQDLLLLKKKADYDKMTPSQKQMNPLTDEELERLDNMGPQTSYQTEALFLHDAKAEFKEKADDSLKEAKNEGLRVKAMKEALLKITPMVTAQKQAANMIKEAAKEEVQSIINDAKDNIDEKMEEEKEKAEEAAEAANIQQPVDQGAGNSEAIDTTQDIYAGQAAIEKGIKKIVAENLILEEELKGLGIDEIL